MREKKTSKINKAKSRGGFPPNFPCFLPPFLVSHAPLWKEKKKKRRGCLVTRPVYANRKPTIRGRKQDIGRKDARVHNTAGYLGARNRDVKSKGKIVQGHTDAHFSSPSRRNHSLRRRSSPSGVVSKLQPLVRVLPFNGTLAPCLDPVVDAPDEPPARPLVCVILLPLGLAELEAPARAAHVLLVPPLEAFAVLLGRKVSAGDLVVLGPDQLAAIRLRLQLLVLVGGDVESLGLADLGAGGWRVVRILLDHVLVRLLDLPVSLLTSGLFLTLFIRSNVASVV